MAFKGEPSPAESETSVEVEKLYAQIGQLKVENDFSLKKKCAEIGDKRQRMEMIDPNHQKLLVQKQCDILAVPRSSVYYQPIPEKPENINMMHLMDKNLLVHPREGVVSMVDWLKEKGYPVGPTWVRRLFKLMGYQTLYRRKHLTMGALRESNKPYLLRGLKVTHANQVWCTDITYIPLARGLVYIRAFIDVYRQRL
jgi:putative transposase